MRVLPNMKVFSPADYYETKKIVKCMAEIDGPCYIRVNRNDVPVITDPDEPFEFGKVKTMKDGKDVVIFATGFLEHGYRRFIERSLREEFGFEGSPIQISVNIREKKKRK